MKKFKETLKEGKRNYRVKRLAKRLKMTEEELVKLTLTLDESKNDQESTEFAAEITGKSIKEIKETQCFTISFDSFHKRKKVIRKIKDKMFFTEDKKDGKFNLELWSTLDFCLAFMIADSVIWKKFKDNPFILNPTLLKEGTRYEDNKK